MTEFMFILLSIFTLELEDRPWVTSTEVTPYFEGGLLVRIKEVTTSKKTRFVNRLVGGVPTSLSVQGMCETVTKDLIFTPAGPADAHVVVKNEVWKVTSYAPQTLMVLERFYYSETYDYYEILEIISSPYSLECVYHGLENTFDFMSKF